jgi:hypothetical protein
MQTTSLRTLREEFVSRIRQLVPDADRPLRDQRQDRRWKPVDRIEDVPGDRLRLFYVDIGRSEATAPGGGIWGCGVEIAVPVRIWTNYGGLRDNEDVDLLIHEDGLDLYYLLDRLRDPVVQGFVGPEPLNWPAWTDGPEGDDPGAVWGAHEIVIRYLARDS